MGRVYILHVIQQLVCLSIIMIGFLASCAAFSQWQKTAVPQRPRIFVTHFLDERLVDYSVFIDFRWSAPVSTDNISSFSISVSESGKLEKATFSVLAGQLQFELYDAPKDALLWFKVKACWFVSCGPFTDPVMTNTSVENPPPKILFVEPEGVRFYLPDTKAVVLSLNGSIAAMSLITYDDSIFWIDNITGEVILETGSASKTLTTARNQIVNMAVDWIGYYLFWLERSDDCNYICKYDISQPLEDRKEVVMSDKFINGTLHYVQVDPFHSTVYYTWSQPNGSHVSLFRSDYHGHEMKRIMGLSNDQNSCSGRCCCSEMALHHIFVFDNGQNEVSNISIYGFDSTARHIWGTDRDGCYCLLIRNLTKTNGLDSEEFLPLSLTVDQHRLYWINRKFEATLYSISKYNGDGFRAESGIFSSTSFILGYNIVALPEHDCLKLKSSDQSILLLNATSSSLTLNFSISTSPLKLCGAISMPSTYYVLHYFERDSDKLEIIEPLFETQIVLTQLKPSTSYWISVGASNYFVSLWKNHSVGSFVLFQTKPYIPSAPANVTVAVLLADTVVVRWFMAKEPHEGANETVFAISWICQLSDGLQANGTVWIRNSGHGEYLTETIRGLNESRIYWFKVLAYDSKLAGYSSSHTVKAKLFQHPEPARLLLATDNSLLLTWISPSDGSVTKFTLEYAEVKEDIDVYFWSKYLVNGEMIKVSGPQIETNVTIRGLMSNQAYAVRVEVVYQSGQSYTWPVANFSVFSTYSWKPGFPGTPYVIKNSDNSGFIMHWSSPDSQTSVPVDSYQLTCRNSELYGDSFVVYKGSDLYWSVTDFNDATPYTCHVRAYNKFGWGPYSNWSSAFLYQIAETNQSAKTSKILKLILIPVFIILFLAFFIAMVVVVIGRWKQKLNALSFIQMKMNNKLNEEACPQPLTDVKSEKFYAINLVPCKMEVSSLMPNFCRDYLKFTRFICDTKNGDVFEGVAKDILGSDTGYTPVILKTINSQELSEQDFEGQMQEVAFMNDMKHRNIISMLGVCLLGEPKVLIFELPDIGDLSSFLHQDQINQTLSVKNLLNFCLDIVSGCQFFEDRHLVHRNLCTKTCFVFGPTSSYYRIKIGGFSLLKDICNTNGSLACKKAMQVKWMAPEAITDNLFTSMSDVWAFGVLMWEIFSLGMEPYGEVSSHSVILQFLKNGDRLEKPAYCPQDIFLLMLSCWRFSPFKRPSFHYVADQLRKKETVIGMKLQAVHICH